jgi:hypothetical protein
VGWWLLHAARRWADGLNLHGGHHNVLLEGNEMSMTGDDPYGLWPVSVDARQDNFSCQQNIVLRNNIARWPRAGGEGQGRVAAGGKSARDFPDCDCKSVPPQHVCAMNRTTHKMNQATCCPHSCFATYAGGSGVQFLNNTCEGAFVFLQFNGDFPVTSNTKWCGPVAVAGNTVRAMSRQGSGCMLDNSTKRTGRDPSPDNWCHNKPTPWAHGPYPPAPTVGGQCSSSDQQLPPPCAQHPAFAACRALPGVGGVCHNNARGSEDTPDDDVACVSATELARGGPELCTGFAHACTIFA